MRNFSIFFKILFATSFVISCSPFHEEPASDSFVELEYTDETLAQQYALVPNHPINGNLSFEVQYDVAKGTKTLFAQAAFHAAAAKNVLFSDISTGVLTKNIYKPKPEEEICGIPGYPDCPGTPTPTPTSTPDPTATPSATPTPDEGPCGIPGFPDCPATPTPTPSLVDQQVNLFMIHKGGT